MKSNVARRYEANNVVPLAARQIVLWCDTRMIPDDCLTNGIFGFDYGLWRYRIPIPLNGDPILTLPDVVARAVAISVRATQNPFGGSHILKPLAYCRRNVVELPPIHCGSSRANCTAHERSDTQRVLAEHEFPNCFHHHSPLAPKRGYQNAPARYVTAVTAGCATSRHTLKLSQQEKKTTQLGWPSSTRGNSRVPAARRGS